MRTPGKITATIGLLTAAVAVAVGMQSIPDIKRYLKIRQM